MPTPGQVKERLDRLERSKAAASGGGGGSATTADKWTTARLLAGNSVDGSANVLFSNKFIVQGTADSGLSGAQFLGALATGILKNTVTTGVLSIAVAGDFPTLNQDTTGLAAKATILATARAIYGNNFDGSAALTQIIASTYGGTGNGFTKFSGPTTSEKTFTLPDSSQTLLYSSGPLGTPSGGTLTNASGLPIASGLSGLSAANRIPYSTSATALTTSANLTFDGTTLTSAGPLSLTKSGSGYIEQIALKNSTDGVNYGSAINSYNSGYTFIANFVRFSRTGGTVASQVDIGTTSNWSTTNATSQLTVGVTGVTIPGTLAVGAVTAQRQLHVGAVGAGNGIYVSATAPSVILGNNDVYASNTMQGLFGLATAAGHYGVAAGDVLLYAYGNSRGNIYINSNYTGTGTTNLILQPSAGNVGIGTGATVSALLHAISTTEQLRLGYDASNYLSTTISSVGSVTFAPTGTNPNITLTPGGTGHVVLTGHPILEGVTSTGALGTGNLMFGTEGTWTPAYAAASGSFTTLTYSNQIGWYKKIGNILYFGGYIDTSNVSLGTASGAITITGLPSTSTTATAVAMGSANNWTVQNPTATYMNASSSVINLGYYAAGGTSFITTTNLTTGAAANKNSLSFYGACPI